MEKSILHFNEVCVGVFDKLVADFYKDPTNIADFVTGITDEIHSWGLMLIQKTLEDMDQMLRDSGKRKTDM